MTSGIGESRYMGDGGGRDGPRLVVGMGFAGGVGSEGREDSAGWCVSDSFSYLSTAGVQL